MNLTTNLDWLYTLAGWTIAGAGLLLLLWALFRDRSRGRRRCPTCWYDMAGVPGLQCPECGTTARNDRHLLRTRRRWRFVCISIALGSIGATLVLIPVVRRDGWRTLVPNVAVIAGLPPAGTEWRWDEVKRSGVENPFSTEMKRRLDAGTIRDWELRWALERVRVIRTRKNWHVDQVIRAGIWPPRWLDGLVMATPRTPGLQPIEQRTGRSTSGTFHHYYEAEQQDQSVGKLAIGGHTIVFDVTVEPSWVSVIRAGTVPGPRHCRVSIPVNVTLSEATSLRGVSDTTLDQAARHAISLSTWARSSGELIDTYLLVQIDRTKAPQLDSIALGAVIDLVRGDEVIRSINLHPMTANDFSRRDILSCSVPVPELRTRTTDDAYRSNWSLRVRGDWTASLREFDCERYWEGQFTIPLSEVPTK